MASKSVPPGSASALAQPSATPQTQSAASQTTASQVAAGPTSAPPPSSNRGAASGQAVGQTPAGPISGTQPAPTSGGTSTAPGGGPTSGSGPASNLPVSAARGVTITKWVFFTLAVSVAPVCLRYFSLKMFGLYNGLAYMLGDGSLYLVSCGIAAEAIGDAQARTSETKVYANAVSLMLSGLSFLVALTCTFAYAMTTSVPASQNRDADLIFKSSLVVFAIAVSSNLAGKSRRQVT